MKKFIKLVDNRFNAPQPVLLHTDRYSSNDNLALIATCNDDTLEPWATYTSNPQERLGAHEVAIKTWSEGRGTDKLLIENNIIESLPVRYIASGFVQMPIYRLTQHAVEAFGI